MALGFDEEYRAAIKKAKALLIDDELLDIPSLMAALCDTPSLNERLPRLSEVLAVPQERCKPGKVSMTQELKEVLSAGADSVLQSFDAWQMEDIY